MKTLMQILDEVSIGCGLKNFRDATNNAAVYLVEHIILASGDIFLKQHTKK